LVTSVVELITRLPRDRFVMLALVPARVVTVPLVEVKFVAVKDPVLIVVIPAEVPVKVVMVADVKVALLSERLETVRLDTDKLVMSALVLLSVLTVPLVEVKLVRVADPLVSTVTLPLA
jgi:hypothetical protein